MRPVPLAYDRASESKVGVFYTKLGERSGNNDHVIVRILNKNKQNLTMYSVKLFRVGTVSIHINKLEAQRNGGEFIQQDGRKVSVNNVIDLDKDRFQVVPQKVASELHPKVRNHGEGPY